MPRETNGLDLKKSRVLFCEVIKKSILKKLIEKACLPNGT